METLVFLAFGFVGLVAHWFKRWVRKECCKNFFVYMSEHRKNSIASVLTMVGGVLMLNATELTQQTMSMAFLAGYSIDSMVNK